VTETFEPVAAPKPVEVELKYRVTSVAAAERYLTAPRVGAFDAHEMARSSRIEDRYVDTDGRALARAGYAVRLRQSKAGTIVSVKSLVSVEGPGGAVRREELEGPAEPTSAARALVLEHAGAAPLVELVTIRQVRRKRQLRDAGTRIELSLDEVSVIAGDREVGRFAELEAELRRGSDSRLAELAAIFDADLTLTRSGESKLEAALAILAVPSSGADGHVAEVGNNSPQVTADEMSADGLASGNGDTTLDDPDLADEPLLDDVSDLGDLPFEGEAGFDGDVGADGDVLGDGDLVSDVAEFMAGVPSTSDDSIQSPEPPDDARLVVGKSPGVTADDHVAEAGRKVLRFHLARMLAREAGTREGLESEELHAMRVATRRQRAAWRVFGASFRPARTKRYRTGLREIAARLGTVRDLDVLLEAADAYRTDMPHAEQGALEPLLRDWHGRRDDARVLLIRELDSAKYQRWVDDYRDFVRTEGAAVIPVGPTQPHRVRDTSPSWIWAAYEQVRAYEPVLRWADIETLHELRIAGKWLRYTMEFVRETIEPDVTPLLARVTALQDHLGLMNDADVAASMARTFLVEHAGDLAGIESAAIGRYLVSREREVARLRRTIAVPWRGVAGIGFRRGLGRVAANL
jgi:CHAD domain-containing protein